MSFFGKFFNQAPKRTVETQKPAGSQPVQEAPRQKDVPGRTPRTEGPMLRSVRGEEEAMKEGLPGPMPKAPDSGWKGRDQYYNNHG